MPMADEKKLQREKVGRKVERVEVKARIQELKRRIAEIEGEVEHEFSPTEPSPKKDSNNKNQFD